MTWACAPDAPIACTHWPTTSVHAAALDVTDPEAVTVVFHGFTDVLGSLDRIIVNGGIGKGAPLGTGSVWPITRPL